MVGRGQIQNVVSGTLDLDYRTIFEAYSAELQHIATFAGQTLLLGGRYQRGEFETRVRLTDFDNGMNPFVAGFFQNPPANQDFTVDLERINFYLYDTWHVTPWLSVTGGVTYDRLRYPDNFRSPPINDRQASLEQVSPKAALTVQPWRGATFRGAYGKAIGGASFDESVRLEPTQLNGFLQSYRSLISESLIGSVAGSEYRFYGASFEHRCLR